MAVRIQFRRGTAAEWTSANPTLAAGELGYETDTTKFKLGDGSTAWTSLGYGGVSQADINNAVANVIDSAPSTLDTLNELAAALGDDANYAATVTNSLANKISFVTDTEANFLSANAVTSLNVAYIASDDPSVVLIGDGSSNFGDLKYVGSQYTLDAVSSHSDETTNVHGISNTLELATYSQIVDHEADTTNVHGIANTADLVVTADLSATETAANGYTDNAIITHAAVTSNVHGIANTLDLVDTATLSSAQDAANTYADNAIADHNSTTTNVHGILDTTDLVVTADLSDFLVASDLSPYATLANATFSGTISLPADTSLGDISAVEFGYLANVTSDVQAQLNAKLATSSAASIYAPIASPTLTGTVGLPADTSIGDVSATEIGYLNNVSSAIQTQLDAKLATSTASSTYAPIDSPTFTTAATLPASTTIGDVSATEISYLNNVSSAIQTQLDAKAPIANPTFTGTTEAVDLTLTGNLYVQGSTTTISTSNLKLRDNMTYLNQAGLFDISGASGDGTNVIYTTSTNHDYAAGDYVTVANVTPSSFDIGAGDGVEILAITENTFTVASTVTDTYTSGGDARGKIHANPDLGWAAGRYTANTYAHAGFFRDATDGVFKVFDGYVPEPDESAFIDTSHNTFALASFAAATVTAANVVATTGVTFADNTIQTSAGVPSLTGFTEKTASYTLDTLDHQDNVVEMNSASATTFTIPTNSALAWPVGASMDIIQTGSGQVTISPDTGVTLNYTPGNKLRTQWSSCTIMKRASDSWIVYGDLTA